MTSDPTDIGHAGKLVIGVNIEHIFYRQCSAEKIAASCVHDTFGFSGGAGGLRKELASGW